MRLRMISSASTENVRSARRRDLGDRFDLTFSPLPSQTH